MSIRRLLLPAFIVVIVFLFSAVPAKCQSTEVSVCTWHGCKSGAESWSIDDSYSDCRSDLESAGFRGTYYMWNANVASWASDYSAAGHEIGSHTVDHPCDTPCCSPNCTIDSLSSCAFTPQQVISYRQNEFEPNISSIEALTGKPVVSAAWPCGCYDPRRSAAASPYFVGARGYYDYVANLSWVEDVNVPTPPDFMNLYSAAQFDSSFIDRAASEGKWAIIVSHSSCSGIDYMGQRQDVLWAAPVGDVLKYIKVRDAATFANYVRTGSAITFDAAHNLGVFQRQKVDGSFLLPIVFDNPVTLKVHVQPTDDVSSVTVDGNPVSFSIQSFGGASYVLFDAALNTPRHVVITFGPSTVYSVVLNPSTVTGGAAPATGTVTLTGVPTGGALVSLSSSNPSLVSVPSSISIPSGSNVASFSLNAGTVNSTTQVVITATYNNTSQSATLTVNPVVVSSLILSPTSVTGGGYAIGTLTLSGVAPAGGALVPLTSTNSAVATVPANATVPAGTSSTTFIVNTSAVAAPTQVTLTATYNGGAQSGALTVNPASGQQWWSGNYAFRMLVTIQNRSTTSILPVHYSVQASVNTASLVSTGQMLPNCADLRVIYFDGAVSNEIDRIIENCNTTSTTVWFGLQRPVAANAQDASYYIYYGNAAAGVPPSNGMNVFVFFEDWENGPGHWTSAGGLDPSNGGTMGTTLVSTDDAFSPTHSQKFPLKAYGGDAFSGFIPVTPGTRYAFSVWGKSATSAYLPIGFDPYTSARTKGTETWFWTSAWTVPAQWGQRTATFTAGSSVAYIKLKSEWWGSGPGTAPVYADNLALRYSLTTEPALTLGGPESGQSGPVVSIFSLNPSSLTGGASSTGTVSLNGVAPSGGAVVTLTSSNTAVATVPPNVTIPEGANTATFLISTVSVGSATPVTLTGTYNASSLSSTLTVNPNSVSSLTLNPASLIGGAGATSIATVTLSGLAPSGGATVTLASSNVSAATVPANVTIAAGTNSGTFTVNTLAVSSTASVTISATYNGTQTAILAVNPAAATLAAVTFNPANVIGGNTSTGTVTLNGVAPAGGATIAITSGNTAVATVPSSVTIAQGAGSASFSASTVLVNVSTPVSISGTYNSSSQSATLTVSPLIVSSVTLSPGALIGGASSTGTVALNGPALAGGAVVALTSSNATVAAVPANVTIPAGSTSVTFPVTTSTVTASTLVPITANYNSSSQSGTLTVNPTGVAAVSLNPASVVGGSSSTGTVTLNAPAPAGGAVVTLTSSNNAIATVPLSVTVAAGATNASFTVTTSVVGVSAQASITGTLNANSQSATLTVTPLTLSALALSPTTVIGGASSTATITLSTPAPTGGALISLTSSNTAVATVPVNVTVAAGGTTATFAVTTSLVSVSTQLSISAAYNSSNRSATLTVNPLAIMSVSLNPTSVNGGTPSVGTVTLNGVAPAGGALIALASSNTSAATVPVSVTVAPGTSTATFTATSLIVSASTQATITGSYNGSSQSAILAVNVSASGLPWWGTSWSTRALLTVKNGSTSTLPVHYSVQALLNTSNLIAANQMLANCNDLRVVFFNGTVNQEIDRVIENCGSSSSTIWFALQRTIAASAQDAGYYIYYANPTAGVPPANGMNVFLFFEDWENGASHWTSAGGLDSTNSGTMGTSTIVTTDSFSPTHSQQFSQKAYGGDAFSGYIPVAASTRYAVYVWAKSATAANFPVGYDPYNSSHTKGTEVWFWTSAWSLGTQWGQRSAAFTIASGVSYIKLKSEWWGSGPGSTPVFADNLALRYALTTEPTLTWGNSENAPQ